MKEQRIIKIQLLKNMIVNLILLTVIFGVFSLFILNQFNNYLYESVDKELMQYKNQLEDISNFIIKDEKIIPIEVKSSDNVKAKSLRSFMNQYSPQYCIRISSKNFGMENSIKSVPLYATFLI